MVEWSITTVLKTVVPRGTGGSNPSLSAKRLAPKGQVSSCFRLFMGILEASCLLGLFFHLRLAGILEERLRQVAIARGVFVKIVLVILFSLIEVDERLHLHGDGAC